jgi:hypothetical protein
MIKKNNKETIKSLNYTNYKNKNGIEKCNQSNQK